MSRHKNNSSNSQLELFDKLKHKLDDFVDENSLSKPDMLILLDKSKKQLAEDDISIPISAFDNDKLSCFETVCKYLKENLNLNYRTIGKIVNRNERTVWITYHNAKKKMPAKLDISFSDKSIPVSLIKTRELSVLESVAVYLKTAHNLKFSEIAKLLHRNQRNIWTVYSRALKKRGWKR